VAWSRPGQLCALCRGWARHVTIAYCTAHGRTGSGFCTRSRRKFISCPTKRANSPNNVVNPLFRSSMFPIFYRRTKTFNAGSSKTCQNSQKIHTQVFKNSLKCHDSVLPGEWNLITAIIQFNRWPLVGFLWQLLNSHFHTYPCLRPMVAIICL